LLALCATACGTTGDTDDAVTKLPVSGAGPFKALAPRDDITQITPPFVLVDSGADLDDPMVISDGNLLALWVTAKRQGQTRIEHADAFQLTEGFGPLILALAADQPWEEAGVYGASVIRGTPWVLVYGAAGAIGWAISDDGTRGEKRRGPPFMPTAGTKATRSELRARYALAIDCASTTRAMVVFGRKRLRTPTWLQGSQPRGGASTEIRRLPRAMRCSRRRSSRSTSIA